MSQKARVLNFLNNGGQLTVKHANSKGILNVREVVRQLRAEGNPIYLNERANGNSFYRLGSPTRKMIAAAYSVAGAEAFN